MDFQLPDLYDKRCTSIAMSSGRLTNWVHCSHAYWLRWLVISSFLLAMMLMVVASRELATKQPDSPVALWQSAAYHVPRDDYTMSATTENAVNRVTDLTAAGTRTNSTTTGTSTGNMGAGSTMITGTDTPSGSYSTSASVSGLHVVHPVGYAPYLANHEGNFVLLRGVDDNALVQYPSDYPEAPPVSAADMAEMAALGFNFLRLPVSWSEIMPSPGSLNQSYLAKVSQVVHWAAQYGIGVLVDMHQDNYSATLCSRRECDGAPSWAVVDGNASCTPSAFLTPCVYEAFRNFWANVSVDGKPLQQWYLQAAISVAKSAGASSQTSNVVGIELMNEPNPTGPGVFEQQSLYPFYKYMIKGLRNAGIAVPLWFEPSAARNFTNNALPEAARFSIDPNLVYAVHMYTGVFSPPFSSNVPFSDLQSSYSYAKKEANVFGTPWMVDEFGSNPTPAWNKWLTEQILLQNNYGVGSGFWLWKQRSGYWYDWSLVNLNGSIHSGNIRAQLLGIPHVDTMPGRLVSTSATPSQLNVVVDGSGGMATLWGGVAVYQGGTTLVPHTLRYVAVDGHPVSSSCRKVTFQNSSVNLGGCLLTINVPSGCQEIVVTESRISLPLSQPQCPSPSTSTTTATPNTSGPASQSKSPNNQVPDTSAKILASANTPSTPTGEPWYGWLWWLLVAMIALAGTVILTYRKESY